MASAAGTSTLQNAIIPLANPYQPDIAVAASLQMWLSAFEKTNRQAHPPTSRKPGMTS